MTKTSWILRGSSLLLLGASLVSAQTAFDVNLGFGSYNDSANGGGIDNANSINAYGACTPNSGDPNCQSLPGLSGFFLGFGADLMFYKHLGAGFSASLQPTRQNYGPLQDRQAFYDFDAIYAPITAKRYELRLIGGVGAAHTGFSISENGCIGTAVCSYQTEPVGTSNHFDVHVGVGVQVYLTDHVFIRPEFDFHYAPGLTDQFGRDSVPGGMIWVGYNFGER
ncbi:MAG TPA: outer membrane beta-barrel protein [Bryobacteraceae bacterium]|nr:outer membrane beta-barrel protein [Bryobacteraceae bacterium]